MNDALFPDEPPQDFLSARWRPWHPRRPKRFTDLSSSPPGIMEAISPMPVPPVVELAVVKAVNEDLVKELDAAHAKLKAYQEQDEIDDFRIHGYRA